MPAVSVQLLSVRLQAKEDARPPVLETLAVMDVAFAWMDALSVPSAAVARVTSAVMLFCV